MNGLAGHDHPPSRPPPISVIGSTSTRADPRIAQSDTSFSHSDSIPSSDDPVYQAHNHQRYETDFSHLIIVIHDEQCIAFLARQGLYCKWGGIL